jgi:hypothetical protein
VSDPKQVTVPAVDFAGPNFWRRANTVAADAGHDGHPVTLVGVADPTNLYQLRCPFCDVTIVEVTVDRSAAGTMKA